MKEHVTTTIDELKDFFKKKPVFTVNDLKEYYREIDPRFKETAFKWRIHDLKQKKLIRNVRRGVYTFESRPLYQPVISNRLKRKYNEIKKELPYSEFCIWETRWINELTIHQPGNFITLIEVEKEALQPVFYFLQNRSKRENIFLKPSKKEIEQYISANAESIVIRPLVTQAPTKEENGVCIPKLEKILVDLFVDKFLFIAYQGQELMTIFENAVNQFSINLSTLFRYANRRKKKDQVKKFLIKNNIIPLQLLE